jgi:hypothetical protein
LYMLNGGDSFSKIIHCVRFRPPGLLPGSGNE